ncbi:MAG: Rv3235 family protein, partial [Beutenbergiaceae bacterium]
MSALAAAATSAVPAPRRIRPSLLEQTRPRDRLAFRPLLDAAEQHEDTDDNRPTLTCLGQLPEPVSWCSALVRTSVEVLLGARAPGQLARWLTADLYTSLSHRAYAANSYGRDARRVTILRVHHYRVDDHHHEASVVLHDGR